MSVWATTVWGSWGRMRTTVPARALTERLESGRLGMKTGEGFYQWTPESIAAERKRYDDLLMAGLRLLAPELPKIADD